MIKENTYDGLLQYMISGFTFSVLNLVIWDWLIHSCSRGNDSVKVFLLRKMQGGDLYRFKCFYTTSCKRIDSQGQH